MEFDVIVKMGWIEIPVRRMLFGKGVDDRRAQSHLQLLNRIERQQPDFPVEIVERNDRAVFRLREKIPGRRSTLEVPHVYQQPIITDGFHGVFGIDPVVDYQPFIPQPVQRLLVRFGNFRIGDFCRLSSRSFSLRFFRCHFVLSVNAIYSAAPADVGYQFGVSALRLAY